LKKEAQFQDSCIFKQQCSSKYRDYCELRSFSTSFFNSTIQFFHNGEAINAKSTNENKEFQVESVNRSMNHNNCEGKYKGLIIRDTINDYNRRTDDFDLIQYQLKKDLKHDKSVF
jgi:hypothetical protein